MKKMDKSRIWLRKEKELPKYFEHMRKARLKVRWLQDKIGNSIIDTKNLKILQITHNQNRQRKYLNSTES